MIAICTGKNISVVYSGEGTVKNEEELHRYYIRTKDTSVSASDIVETCEEKNGEFYIVTREISVESMHKLASNVKKTDASAFFAGINN
jgi:hypothetical protein